jgi:Tfp pilus assembly protein PilE
LPSYRDHVRKSRRAEAQSQFLVDTRGYAGALRTIGVPTPNNVAAAYDLTLATTADHRRPSC